MKVIAFIALVVILVGLVLVGEAWVRFKPLDVAALHQTGGPDALGDWPEEGGFAAVRQVEDPQAALAALATVGRQARLTHRFAGSEAEGHISFVTRSLFWGFPDITNIWIKGDRLHIRAHLVYGRSDFGVNRKRVEAWLDQAGLR